MKTKVSSENSVEGVSSQTTAVTTATASTAQSSVWSICDISTDSHVELRDITPSISPVFTDDQVHALTRNPPEVDVLSEHFLPPDTFKRIDEVLSSGGQTNLLYSDPVLSDTLKQNDVLLPGELAFHGAMFPSFDSIVEADRILNKRDESSPLNTSEVKNSEVDPSNSINWHKDGLSLADTTGNPAEDKEDENIEKCGGDNGLRRSPRKRIQVKKDSGTLKTGNPASKSISRGKDISKLKYANAKPEVEKKEVRRSGQAQKKVDKEESNADKNTKDIMNNNKKKNTKDDDDETDKDSTGQEDCTSKNVRRSPRNQSKAPMEGKQKATRRRRGKDPDDSDDNKQESNVVCDEKESEDKTLCDSENKSTESNCEASKETNHTEIDEAESDAEEKPGIRKSRRLTRNRVEQTKEGDGKIVNEKNKTNAKENKEKADEIGLKTGDAKIKGKNESDISKKESIKTDDNKNISKRNSSVRKPDKSEPLDTQGKGNESEEKALRKKKTETKIEPSESDEMEKKTRVSSRREERKTKLRAEENVETVTNADENRQNTEKIDIVTKEGKSIKEHESGKEELKTESAVSAGTDDKTAEDSDKNKKKPREEGQQEDDSDADLSEHEEEEFNEDSDYDPEYDPDRLWCVCRKPHGNRFMICCDHCEEWFHGMCVGITMTQGRQMEKNGQDYVCPKCKAKITEESIKEAQPTSETTAKENELISATSEHVDTKEDKKPSPTPEHHRHRREHLLKMKIPGDREETRKRRHSSHRRSREEMLEEYTHKRSKESDKLFAKLQSKDEKKKKIPEHKGFKIPKKVRTTPTPASYMNYPMQPKCLAAGCSMLADYHSLYCSPECVQRHAEESLKILAEEKKKRMGSKSTVSSSKNVTSPTSSLLGPVPWNSYPAPVSSQAESTLPKEGIAVIERSTGRVIAGVAAPSQEEIFYWLQDHPSFEVLRPPSVSVGKDEKKKEKREDSEKTVRDNIRKSLKEILTTRSTEQQDVGVTEEDIDKCSHNVEGEMFSFFGDTGHRYKNKYRSLMFNLKDPRNKVLYRHVLSGEITVDRLVRMTPEQLASPELATWREQETKHTLEMIRMNQEEINATKAHIKKTHKGEVEIDDDDLSTLENSAELKVEKGLPDSNTSSSTLLLDTTDEHRIHLFDLNCRICTGKIAPPGEPPRRETPAPLVSTTSIVQAVAESSIPSPTPMDIVTSASSPDSGTVTQPPVSPSVFSKTPKKIPAVWKGFVMMQNVAKFGTSAYRVSGPCDDLLQLLPDTLHVQGRIAHEQVWDYLLQLKSSTSREVCVIRYEASSDDEKLSYVSLYSYFYSRKRCGVVSNCYTGVKDMYLVPLASHQPVPPEMLPFDGPGLDEPRPHMLLGVIVRAKAVFKRPRALSQRSLSPPSKRRTSSASVETNSSDGGTVDSPAGKQGVLSELHDSPPADIDDIVFQYNTTQAKMASKESRDSPATKASPTSEISTPSMTSSSGAVTSPPAAVTSPTADKSAVPSLEAQKQQLLDLQERARQYILAQTQRKGTASVNDEPQEVGDEKSETADVAKVDMQGGEGEEMDGDAPYDPEEELELDLNPTDPTPAKPAVSVTKPPASVTKPPVSVTKPAASGTSEEPSKKPSSLQMLVSTLQRLQSAAIKSVSPHLAALSTVLPIGSTSAPRAVPNQPGETTAAATASQSAIPTSYDLQSIASASSILQPIVPVSGILQSVSSLDSASQPTVSSSLGPLLASVTDQQRMSAGLTGRLPQPAGATDRQPMSVGIPGRIPQPSGMTDRQPMSAGGHIPQPSGVTNQEPMSAGNRIPQPLGVTDRQPMSAAGHPPQPSATDRHSMSGSLLGRIPQPSGMTDRQPMSAGGRIPQPLHVADLQPVVGHVTQLSGMTDRQPDRMDRQPVVGHLPQPSSATDRQPLSQLLGVADRQPVSFGLTGRMPQRDVSTSDSPHSPISSIRGPQFSASADQILQPRPSGQRHQPPPQDNRWNPSEPPQVTRHVNNVTQQIGQNSGLRPEDRARLAAHESRLESRENRRVPSEHRDEHYEQRRTDDRHRTGWYNDPRHPRDSRPADSSDPRHPRDSRAGDSSDPRHHRDSRPGDSSDPRFPRDSRPGDWRDQHRPGRQWYDDEQRRNRHEHPSLDERPRYEERREERRFKEHWSRDRWRR